MPGAPKDAPPESTRTQLLEGLLTVAGSIVSSASGAPLSEARLVYAGRTVWLDQPDGTFRVVLQSDGTRNISLSARNHQEATASLPDPVEGVIELGQIELAASHSIEVSVVASDGSPAVGAMLMLNPAHGEFGSEASARVTVALSEAGVARIAISAPCEIMARHGDQVSHPKTVYPTDSHARIQLTDGIRLGFREESTQSALRGVAARLTKLDHHPWSVFEMESDERGLASTPLAAGRYQVDVLSPGFTLVSGTRSLKRAFRPIEVIDVSDAQVVWLGLERSAGASIVLMDVETDLPASPARAWCASYEEPPFAPQPGWVALGEPQRFEDHRIDLARFHLSELGGDVAVFASAPGYEERLVRASELDLEAVEPHVLRLGRVQGHRIRVLDAQGARFPHLLSLRRPDVGEVLWEGRSDADGLLPPIHSETGFATLTLGRFRKSRPLAEIAFPESVQAAEPITVTIGHVGCIVIEPAPAFEGRLYGSDGDGFVCEGKQEGDKIVFTHLPPGRYEVGTSEQLATLSLRMARGLTNRPVQLAEGDELYLDWDPLWMHTVELEGHASISGVSPEELFVVPLCSPVPLPVPGGFSRKRFPVARDGVFRIREFAGLPTQLTFVRALEGGGVLPVGCGVPGEVAIVSCGVLEVDLGDWPPGEEVRITCSPRIPGAEVLERCEVRGVGGALVTVGALPVETASVRLAGGGTSIELPLELSDGLVTRLRPEHPRRE